MYVSRSFPWNERLLTSHIVAVSFWVRISQLTCSLMQYYDSDSFDRVMVLENNLSKLSRMSKPSMALHPSQSLRFPRLVSSPLFP